MKMANLALMLVTSMFCVANATVAIGNGGYVMAAICCAASIFCAMWFASDLRREWRREILLQAIAEHVERSGGRALNDDEVREAVEFVKSKVP